MLYRKLGGTGIEISTVGLGTWAIGGWMWGGTDEPLAVQAIQAALDQGINLINTAPAYGFGLSEEIVGRAIAGRRDAVVLATKCGLIWDRQEGQFFFHSDRYGAASGPSEKAIYRCLRPASIRAELEASLKRLGTDHVDLYQTHWQDPTTPIAQTMEALVKLKEEGKIRAIGVSNASVNEMKAYGPIDADQERYSLLERAMQTSGGLDYCRQHQISVLAYSPLDNGLLTGKIRPDREYGRGDLRKTNPRFQPAAVEQTNAMLEGIRPIADRHGVSMAQGGDRLDDFPAGNHLRIVRRSQSGSGGGERRRGAGAAHAGGDPHDWREGPRLGSTGSFGIGRGSVGNALCGVPNRAARSRNAMEGVPYSAALPVLLLAAYHGSLEGVVNDKATKSYLSAGQNRVLSEEGKMVPETSDRPSRRRLRHGRNRG